MSNNPKQHITAITLPFPLSKKKKQAHKKGIVMFNLPKLKYSCYNLPPGVFFRVFFVFMLQKLEFSPDNSCQSASVGALGAV